MQNILCLEQTILVGSAWSGTLRLGQTQIASVPGKDLLGWGSARKSREVQMGEEVESWSGRQRGQVAEEG